MANNWHVRFEPTTVFLTPQGGGNFAAVTSTPGAPVAKPNGSFPAVIAARLNFSDSQKGPPPVKPGDPKAPATLQFLGRPVTPAGTPPLPFISLGVIKGKVDYDTSGAKPVPVFTCDTRKVGAGPATELDFTPGTDPLMVGSDWVMRIQPHPQTFITPFGSFFIQLPWQFVDNPARLVVSARLTVNGTLESDETQNGVLDIPLTHKSVPDDANPTGQPLVFFGVRNLYTKTNAHSPNPRTAFRLPAGNNTLNIIVHSSVDTFCKQITGTTASAVLTAAVNIMMDGTGFDVVNSLFGPAADADCATHWKQVGGRFMARKITDPNQNKPSGTRLEDQFAAALAAGTTFNIPNGMEEILPFFDFYIFAENVEPIPGELAHSEVPIPSVPGSTGGFFITQVQKALATPIAIAAGTGPSSPLRALLAQINPSDRVNLLASTICHEIGHAFGLRHALAFVDAPPYLTNDAAQQNGPFSRGVMGSASIGGTSSGTFPFPPQAFGPVHSQQIQKLFF